MLVKTNYNEIIEISIYILLYSMGEAIKKILGRKKMVIFIESLIGIILFTIIIVALTLKDPLTSVGDYPPAIRDRCMELGLIEKRKQRFTRGDIIRKAAAMIIFVFIFAFVLKFFNGDHTFQRGFRDSYLIWQIIGMLLGIPACLAVGIVTAML